jgi:dipeptidyl aminopeptidase/acylaminoacyl peptidase
MSLWAKFGCCLGAAALLASISSSRGAEQTLTPAQALNYVRIGDLHFSPDGTKLAYVEYSYRWDWLPHLWLLETATGNARELTPAGKAERAPQWSADGKILGFLSNRGGKTQVYAMPAQGGAAAAITARKNGVENFHFSPDGQAIAYLAKDDAAPDDDSGPQLADDERKLSRLWTADLAAKTARAIATPGYRIDEFQWRDRAHILVSATDKPRVEEFVDAVYSVSTADGVIVPVSRPPQPFAGLLVSPDATQFSVRATHAAGPLERDLLLGTIGRGDLIDVSAPIGLAVAEVRWHEPAAIWVRVVDGFRNRIYRLSQGAVPASVDLPLSVDSFDVSRDGAIAFAGGDFDRLPEIYIRSGDGAIRQLTHVQQGWNSIRLAQTAVFRTKSFDGTEIEAALMKPREVRAGERLPLVLLVHGGPSSNFSAGYGWETGWAQLLVSHGYAVLLVNPRGSNGYSEDFLKANRGDWGGGDYKDLMSALDAAIAKGGIDPDRLGIGGWSYGGEMSEWAITQSDRFKAAVVGAGVYDQQAEFETESDPAGDEWYFGTPWEHPDVYARNSPASFIGRARTPTLIFDGEDDTSNPVGQSKGLYRALKHLGVETQMVLYPGEGHSPRKGSYNIDMFERILAWYDSHVKRNL